MNTIGYKKNTSINSVKNYFERELQLDLNLIVLMSLPVFVFFCKNIFTRNVNNKQKLIYTEITHLRSQL